MRSDGVNTLAEIRSQPVVWAKTLNALDDQAQGIRALFDSQNFERIIFTGCGSTYYLAMSAAALFQSLTNISATAYPASEIALHPDIALGVKAQTILVAISRSGATTETLEAVRTFRSHQNAPVVAIVCDDSSPLAAEANLVVAAAAAQEKSIAQTRSFTSMLLIAQGLAALAAGRDHQEQTQLPALGERIIQEYENLAQHYGNDVRLRKFFVLGSGLLYGIACEAMLKLKEMSQSYSEAYHTLELRHGPMSMLDDRTLIIGLLSNMRLSQEVKLLQDMKRYGVHSSVIIPHQDEPIDIGIDAVINLRADVPAWMQPVLYLPLLQLTAYYRALANGADPDRPKNLEAVVSLDTF